MSGIYIHIPFCKQACNYCDFHFSTKTSSKTLMLEALAQELELRKWALKGQTIQSVYFGGGTPSVLKIAEIEALLEVIENHYTLEKNAEITLEANPDDLTEAYVAALSKTPINRLSIGVQSFNEHALKFMNRAHTSSQAINALEWVQAYFTNYSLDLIYGLPAHLDLNPASSTLQKNKSIWQQDLALALSFNPYHISCYALTVEPKTLLAKQISSGALKPLEEEKAAMEYAFLKEKLQACGYEHYEFSNFARPGYFAVNNTGYWEGKSYLGIGPSAHSYDGQYRSWNVANNPKYIKSIAQGVLPLTREFLNVSERYNEYIMTGLRTAKGVSLNEVKRLFGAIYHTYLLKEAAPKLAQGSLVLEGGKELKIAAASQFLTDGLAAHLFYIDP